ncbi:MAG TPA: hypothetical protein VFS76_16220 [Pyrinomonadaceae bacterium]|nr:hypothetical protein [Pyrinomonadaceae bacterium]
MKSVVQSGDKKYRVILLLVVGLTAFSSAMKELNQLREFTRDASNTVVSWSHALQATEPVEKLAPVEVPRTAVRLEVCENNQLKQVEPVIAVEPVEPVVEPFAAGGSVAQAPKVEIKDVGKTFVSRRSERREEQVAAIKKHRLEDIEFVELRKQARRLADLKVTIMADDDGAGDAEIALPPGLNVKLPKVKTHRQIFVTPEEREIFLKNLNRSINLRSAG